MSNNKTLFSLAAVAALSLLGAAPAMAAGEFLDAPAPAVSTLSRAAVQADFVAARSSGSLVAAGEGAGSSQTLAVARSGRDRAAVIAEFRAARDAGTLVAAGEGLAADHVPAAGPQSIRALAQALRPVTQ